MKLVRCLARRYRRSPLGYEDAVGIGNLVIASALVTWEAQRHVPFEHYVAQRAIWAMQDGCRNVRGYRAETGDSETPTSDEALELLRSHHDQHYMLYDALCSLQTRLRIVVLFYMAGWRQHEIGSMLGVSESRISQLLRRARRQLAPHLGEEFS